MNTRIPQSKLIILAISVCFLLAVMGCLFLVSSWEKPSKLFDGKMIGAAVQHFCADHQPLPDRVTFSQLISEGYLPTNALQEFGAKEVVVHLKSDPKEPGMILMEAQMPDGTYNVLMGDGSVQQISKKRLQDNAPLNRR